MKLLRHMVVIGCLVLAVVASAWSAGKDETRPEEPEWKQDSYAHLKKRVGLTRFQNKSVLLDDRLATAIDEILADQLPKTDAAIVPIQEATPAFAALRERQPRHLSGMIDNMTLTQVGRDAGMNAVVAGTIMEVRHFKKEMGYWWFRDVVYFIEIQLHCSVYGTETGAKVLDITVQDKVDLPEELYLQIESGDFAGAFPDIENLVVVMATLLAQEVGDKVEEEPFKMFIKEMDGSHVTVSSGTNAGLRPGDLFAVHDSGHGITGKEEHRFFIVGKQTGILRIDTVRDDAAEGMIVQGRITGRNDCLKPIVEPSFFERLLQVIDF